MLNMEIRAREDKMILFFFFLSQNCSITCKALSINLFCTFSCVCTACGQSLLKKYSFVKYKLYLDN